MRKAQLATLCYVQQNHKTLMLHRVKKEDDMHMGKWNGLGGKFEAGETPEACAVREIREESGLTATKLNLKGHITFPLFSPGTDWYVFVFVIPEFKGKLIESPEGHLEWVDNKKLMNLNLWEGDKIFLPWLNDKHFFSAIFEYKEKKLKNYSVEFY